MEFSRQEYWSRLPFPSPGDLPKPEIEPGSTCIAGRFFTDRATREAQIKDAQSLSYLQHTYTKKVFIVSMKVKLN